MTVIIPTFVIISGIIYCNELTIIDLQDIWKKQNGRCAITNIPLHLVSDNFNIKASIDRIDSTIGYIPGNVQIVSYAMNMAKNSSTNDNALEFVRLIRENA